MRYSSIRIATVSRFTMRVAESVSASAFRTAPSRARCVMMMTGTVPRFGPPALVAGGDGNMVLPQHAGDVREHAGPVYDREAQVEFALDRLDRRDAHALLRRAQRHEHSFMAALVDGAGQADHVADHAGGGRFRAGALADEQDGAGGLRGDEDGVELVLDRGERMRLGDERRMDARLDAGAGMLEDGQRTQDVAELLLRLGEVFALDAADALAMHLRRRQPLAQRQRAEDGEFLRRVMPVNVQAGVRLAQALAARLVRARG